MNNRYLYKAKKIYKEEWVEGFYVLCRGHHYFFQYMILITDSMSDIQNGLR